MPFDEHLSTPEIVSLNVRKLEAGDAKEWDKAQAVQAHINAGALEYDCYGAGVMTYRPVRKRMI